MMISFKAWNWPVVLVLLATVGTCAAEPLPRDGGTLLNGYTYTVDSDTSRQGGAGTSALSVSENSIVYLNIIKGATLTVKGGDASGTTAGGAGIFVPPTSTLYIVGDGTLIATGGDAAKGGDGANGTDAGRKEDQKCELCGNIRNCFYNGTGGKGGDGGGGAGAGIGGTGGSGGAGGSGGKASEIHYRYNGNDSTHKGKYWGSNFCRNGDDGNPGGTGAQGAGMGKVYVLGTVKVIAKRGAAAGNGGSGGQGDTHREKPYRDWSVSGGGGGGGGAGGGSPTYGIGGGGSGGGGGGQGGGGDHLLTEDANAYFNNSGKDYTGKNANFYAGTGGMGGGGAGGGRCAAHRGWDGLFYVTSGAGGAGGANGTVGGNGELYVSPRAGVADQSGWRFANVATAHTVQSAPRSKIVFKSGYLNGLANEANDVPVLDAILLMPFPDLLSKDEVAVLMIRNGYEFDGWWTTPSGSGTCIYDSAGRPRLPFYDQIEAMTLHARWRVSPTALRVNSAAEGFGTKLGEITLRDAVRALVEHEILADTNGYRRITFDLPRAQRTIRLNSPIEIPENTPALEICGLVDGDSVVLDGQGKTQIFAMKGRSITLSFLQLVNGSAGSTKDGGAVTVGKNSFLYATDCVFANNSARNGGAISAESEVSVFNCTFANNQCAKGGHGSAASLNGAAAIANSTFSRNRGASGGVAPAFWAGSMARLLHCTFEGNGKSIAHSPLAKPSQNDAFSATTLYAVNTIFADDDIGAGSENNVAFFHSAKDTPSAAFVGLGLPQTNDVYGLSHIWYEPRHSEQNLDAALVFCDDIVMRNVAMVENSGKIVPVCGNSSEADIPIVSDMFGTVRLCPVRGAIRIVSGCEQPKITLEGVLTDKVGNVRSNVSENVQAEIAYDDGERTTVSVPLKTDTDGFFGLQVPVEGSDGSVHNVKSVSVPAINDAAMTVSTVPYAFVAASATALVTGDGAGDRRSVDFAGDLVLIGSASVDQVSVVSNLNVGSTSFVAGSIGGFGDLVVDGIELEGGTLSWLRNKGAVSDGGAASASAIGRTGDARHSFGDPTAMEGTGLDSAPFDGAENGGSRTILAKSTGSFTSERAEGDGFLQLYVAATAVAEAQLGLKVGDFTVTPRGGFANSRQLNTPRKMVWTVPIRKGESFELLYAAPKDSFEIRARWQFVYFGVTQKLVDIDKN